MNMLGLTAPDLLAEFCIAEDVEELRSTLKRLPSRAFVAIHTQLRNITEKFAVDLHNDSLKAPTVESDVFTGKSKDHSRNNGDDSDCMFFTVKARLDDLLKHSAPNLFESLQHLLSEVEKLKRGIANSHEAETIITQLKGMLAVETSGVKQLRDAIENLGGSSEGCLEKQDLQQQLLRLLNRPAR